MFKVLGTFLAIVLFFLSKWSETDKAKKEEKNAIANEIKEALKEPDKNIRASRLNGIVGKLRG